jgi:hypothetical protein
MLVKWTLLLTLIAMAPACTNSADEQAEPVDENAGNQANAESPSTGNEADVPKASNISGAEANGDAATNAAAETSTNASGTSGNTAASDVIPSDVIPSDVIPSDVTAPSNAETSNAASSNAAAAGAAGKVVRYALNDTAILASPEASASQVSTLKKGESVLIEDLGAFGKISDGKFVSKNDLSEKAVPRDSVSNPWN